MEGPSVMLPSAAATPFGLLVHELATNAAKYGALSVSRGTVKIMWEVIQRENGHRLRWVWTEQDGPPVSPPTKTGFGTEVIEHGLAEAQVQREFRAEGVVCTVELPLTAASKQGR
jgi:two-component system CheB/CheR fusion protein